MPRPRGPSPSPIAERFWSKVDQRGAEECWPWLAGLDVRGYGRFFVPGRPRGNNRENASRVAYRLTHGEIPEGLHVLHSCDNPPCCNPRHLRAGTNLDNIRDRAERRRGREHRQDGEANANAKISATDAAAIRRAVSAGESQMQVAARFGIKQPQVSRIVRGERWRSVLLSV